MYDDDSSTGIIYTIAGDIAVPVLLPYDKEGKRVDSLSLSGNASAFGLVAEIFKRVEVSPAKTILVIDSTVIWNEAEDGRIKGSEKFALDTFLYVVDGTGRIIRQ